MVMYRIQSGEDTFMFTVIGYGKKKLVTEQEGRATDTPLYYNHCICAFSFILN